MIPKFRAWHIEKKEMSSVICINLELETIYIGNKDPGFYQEDLYEPLAEFILMQSTGLTDRNGKEIFEGDIIEYEDSCDDKHIFKVEDFGRWPFYTCINEYGKDSTMEAYPESSIVIGNIYENSELLEKSC